MSFFNCLVAQFVIVPLSLLFKKNVKPSLIQDEIKCTVYCMSASHFHLKHLPSRHKVMPFAPDTHLCPMPLKLKLNVEIFPVNCCPE